MKSAGAVCAVLVAMLAGAIVPLHLAAAQGSSATLNTVVVDIQPSNSTLNQYAVLAYNVSGDIVAQSQSQYGSTAFELPAGTYIFVATAGSAAPGPMYASGTNGGIAAPTVIVPPRSEYGYITASVDGPSSLTIKTQPEYSIGLSQVTAHVSYANGTAASDAYVSASTMGEWGWWGGPKGMVLWNSTAPDGTATLNIPDAPMIVSAWKSVAVQLPKNDTTVQTDVGGEVVNVTVSWNPTYVQLGGSVMLLPPEQGANITLHVQQPIYRIMQPATDTVSPVGITSAQSSVPVYPIQQVLGDLPARAGVSAYYPYIVIGSAVLLASAFAAFLFVRQSRR
ncbi:MAG: hypothetical protein JRN39_01580 [Nitrososphaerota archaeon]|nr:hypothetical protein [Nitrososphaerota archaeon]MDG6939078.1 hypothetical protein [Nitrososphaerota archaeon]